MRTSRRRLIIDIAKQTKELRHKQAEVSKQKNYLFEMVKDHQFVLFTLLIPAFMWGWRKGKEHEVPQSRVRKGTRKIAGQLANMGMMTALSHLKKRILSKI